MSLSFEQKLDRYAELTVKVGVGLQKGQRLMLRGSVEAAPLVRLVVEKAYQAGAGLVEVLWDDDASALARYRYAAPETFDSIPTAAADALLKGGENGDALLAIRANDPDLLAGQNADLITKVQRMNMKYSQPFSRRITGKEINWSIAAAPVPAWAKKVFPDLSEDEAMEELWETIFRICRVDQDDPVAAWTSHLNKLAGWREHLDARAYRELRYKAPGTDLVLGMPENQHWMGGRSVSSRFDIDFVANMPTEEVFSAPHREKAEGVVNASKPLSYAGTLIEDFQITFEGGRVVDVKAAKGEAVLKNLIETDEGSTRLGEVALVPHSSPISASGILFYNTLFDENASCHLAVGKAYRPCIVDGVKMSDEEFMAAGGNDSLTHVDFMIGSDKMDIDGVTESGEVEPIMRAGELAFGD